MNHVTLGIERLVDSRFELLRGLRVGAILNPTSVDRDLRHLDFRLLIRLVDPRRRRKILTFRGPMEEPLRVCSVRGLKKQPPFFNDLRGPAEMDHGGGQ